MRPGYDMNTISTNVHKGEFSKEDYVQFCQLIGYSVSGFGDLSMIPLAEVDDCDGIAAQVVKDSEELE